MFKKAVLIMTLVAASSAAYAGTKCYGCTKNSDGTIHCARCHIE